MDYVPDVDDVTKRTSLDTVKNSHGESFIEFLKESKMCIINGRICSTNDDFTSISVKGKAVVFAVPYSELKYCKYFDVHSIRDLMTNLKLKADKSMPDHSIVRCDISTDYAEIIRSQTMCVLSNTDASPPPRYKFDNIPSDFFNSESITLLFMPSSG